MCLAYSDFIALGDSIHSCHQKTDMKLFRNVRWTVLWFLLHFVDCIVHICSAAMAQYACTYSYIHTYLNIHSHTPIKINRYLTCTVNWLSYREHIPFLPISKHIMALNFPIESRETLCTYLLDELGQGSHKFSTVCVYTWILSWRSMSVIVAVT